MIDVPQPPRGFTPPDITDMMMDFTWYTKWQDLNPEEAGATTIYDPANDRVFIEPRPSVFHDEMARTLVEKSPLPRLPDVMSPAAAMSVGDGDWHADIPTIAEGLQNVVARLEDRELHDKDTETELRWLYKHVASFYAVDIPSETRLNGGYASRNGPESVNAKLEHLYRELRFDNKLPKKKVEYDR